MHTQTTVGKTRGHQCTTAQHWLRSPSSHRVNVTDQQFCVGRLVREQNRAVSSRLAYKVNYSGKNLVSMETNAQQKLKHAVAINVGVTEKGGAI